MRKKKPNLLIIGNPHSHPSAEAFLGKFITIVKEICNKAYVISGDEPPNYKNILWVKLRWHPKKKVIGKFINFIEKQIELIWIIIKNREDYDLAIILPTSFIFPTIFLRLISKKVAIFVAQKPNSPLMELLCKLNCRFSNLLIVESESVIKNWKIGKYKEKIVIGSIYVDTNFFKKHKEICERENIVGYVGILNERKGIKELVKAIHLINKSKDKNINFFIGGNGLFKHLVKNLAVEYENVIYGGFIPNKDLPNFYNELRLFVLPSYSEGLPNVILEAMACGTPVLATPVGAIPNVIRDGETGFIMENNSPECIAKNIIRALNHPNLEQIAQNARVLVKREFLFEKAVKRWRELLKTIRGKK
ncbi:MAG: hypothetical protein DRI61_16890 [Chloroflexi bacterium]|nr:MAG: hypothetical protein DRI61_16890 [Chloroflexota bacterium]